MKTASRTGAYLFAASLLILVGNDWFAKQAFHNALTGKLSDVAGLFALPFLFSMLRPRWTLAVHLGCAGLFMFWKSELAQPVIDSLNACGLPLHRTVDYSDYAALLSTVASYYVLRQPGRIRIERGVFAGVLAISCVAFVATTMPPRNHKRYLGINREYRFPFSQPELVSRLNTVQARQANDLSEWSGKVDFDSQRNVFYYRDTGDTIAVLLDYRRVRPGDTLRLRTALADIQILGDNSTSTLKLLSVRYAQPFGKTDEATYKAQAVRYFEKHVIRKISHVRKAASL